MKHGTPGIDGVDPVGHSRRAFLSRCLALSPAIAARTSVARLLIPAGGSLTSVVAACGGGDDIVTTAVPLFSGDHVLVAGRTQRIPLALVAADNRVDDDDKTAADDAPIEVAVRRGDELIERLSVPGHVVDHDHGEDAAEDHQHANLLRYYPLRTTLPDAGIYDLDITAPPDGDGRSASATLAIQAFDPSQVGVPLVDYTFPTMVTPTVDDPTGVDLLCSRFEPCPFHELSVAQILDDRQPMAVLVATPAFCQTAYCGPVLETLIDASAAAPDVGFVHLEFYANPNEVDGNFNDPRIRLAPAVEQLGLRFEPSLFLVDADGVIVDRIDNVFDRAELDAALQALTTV